MKPILLLFFALPIINYSLSAKFWEETNGPHGGLVRSMDVSPDGIIFAGFGDPYLEVDAEIFRSEDNGETWSQVFQRNQLQNRMVYTISAGWDGLTVAGCDGQIFVSQDGGENWAEPETEVIFYNVKTILTTEDGRVYTGSGSGVNRSTDRGVTWENMTSKSVTSLCQDTSGIIYAGALSAGVYISTDSGTTWNIVNEGIGYGRVNQVARDAENNIYAVSGSKGVFIFDTETQTWTNINYGTDFTNVVNITFDSENNPVIYANDGLDITGVFKLEGSQWNDMGVSIANITCMDHTNENLFIGSNGLGIWRSTDDGANWRFAGSGLNKLIVPFMAVDAVGSVYAAADEGGLFKTTNKGDVWESVLPVTESIIVTALAAGENNVLFVNEIGEVFLSTDNAGTWNKVHAAGSMVQYGLAMISNNRMILYLDLMNSTISGILYSDDTGQTWDTAYYNTEHPILEIREFEGNIAAATVAGIIFHPSDMPVDEGWEYRPAYPNGDTLNFNFIDFNSEGTLYAGLTKGIFKSSDFGLNWEEVITGRIVRAMGINKNDYIFYADHSYDQSLPYDQRLKKYRSTDGGNYWEDITSGMGGIWVNDFKFDSDDYVYAGTYFNGVYRSKYTSSGIDDKNAPENKFVLYPNPAEDFVNINYYSETNSCSKITIYDINGNIVFEDKYYQVIGDNSVRINISQLEQGSYILNMESNNTNLKSNIKVVR